jgi:hypothetical protein
VAALIHYFRWTHAEDDSGAARWKRGDVTIERFADWITEFGIPDPDTSGLCSPPFTLRQALHIVNNWNSAGYGDVFEVLNTENLPLETDKPRSYLTDIKANKPVDKI